MILSIARNALKPGVREWTHMTWHSICTNSGKFCTATVLGMFSMLPRVASQSQFELKLREENDMGRGSNAYPSKACESSRSASVVKKSL
jgi:hypothetical protein